MNEYLIPLTSACTLVTLNYLAIKVHSKMLIDSHERLLAPLLTGIASIIMMLVPFPASLGLIDLRSLPIFMAGLRYGLPVALFSAILPGATGLMAQEHHAWFNIAQDLLAPALISSYFHNKEFRNNVDIPIRLALQLCACVFLLRMVSYELVTQHLTWSYTLDQLFMFAISFSTLVMIIVMVNDENTSWRLQRKLEMQANQDGLTRLPNLRSFLPIADTILHKRKVSIMMIDLDNFKQYNDRYGHLEGDQLLQEVSAVLRQFISENDYLARYGGEEFILLSTEIHPEQVLKYGEYLCASVASVFEHKKSLDTLPITVSIGISIAASMGADLRSLISEADYALYQSKHGGKNRSTLYTQGDMNEQKMNA
ncbi:GGDEF domain-containing protein [Paenibacillus roseipurpureus]|uniref:GGDEF domain-containing protein n=1 Tax=Paenibacillus roseopurpureus TaxID=2918901 RepID=A0AA96LS71_9BACL|nr:GGDEF domain-containing protein [Paenibacillus sp. MBLB1832]WNR45581.1 GGDEF domain-containing protein [Paenibacillus sp. MBLB1832]